MAKPPNQADPISSNAKKIALTFAEVFSTPSGQLCLQHLKSQTINNVSGPEVGTEKLLHLEGQRYAVAMIQQLVDLGHTVKKGESK